MLRQNRIIIDMEAIRHNYRIFRQMLPETVQIMPVIKANAYGHGMLETAHVLETMGVTHFAVALPDEGIQLRLGGISSEILVLGAAMPNAVEAAIQYDLTQTVFTPEMLSMIDRQAANQHRQAAVHIKLDTGMNRIGLRTQEEALAVAQAAAKAPNVHLTGIYTHFAAADEDAAYTRAQLERFHKLREAFPPDVPVHVANSAAALLEADMPMDMVRQGIALYGYPPVPTRFDFHPALSWISEVVHVKEIETGETVGYGCSFKASCKMRVATVAVGYGDGYHRSLSNGGEMLIHGKRAPIIGRVCMDQTMVDVTHIPDVMPGDEAVLIGRQGNEQIDAEMLAEWAGTISYEVLLAITQRVPRIYENLSV